MALVKRRIRRGERWAWAALAVLITLGVAAWQIPPLLDWSQSKTVIAGYASVRLGRRITIGGQVHLTLLPRATLLADNVTLADRGDGISAKLGTLRLEISIGGLLAGRVVPQSLSIESPVVTLPWPLPRGSAATAPPTVSREFAASMYGGTLTIGGAIDGATARQVSARFHTDPDTGSFDAQGTAVVAGLPWRFTALVGAPGRDGVSALTLTLDGQTAHTKGAPAGLSGAGGAIHGRILSDGSIAGHLLLRGSDLSKLGGGPQVAWQVDGEVQGDGTKLDAPALHLMLGTSPGRAELRAHLASPASINMRATVGTIPAGAWIWRLLQATAGAPPSMSADLDLSAAAMPAADGVVHDPHIALSLGKDGVVVRSASATLPGGAAIVASGRMAQAERNHGGQNFLGHAHLTAPDLRHTLRWLTGGGLGDLPDAALKDCDVQGNLALDATRISLSELAGELDDSATTGSLALTVWPRPSLDADLAFDRFDASRWHLTEIADKPLNLAAIAGALGATDSHIRVRAGQVTAAGLALRQAVFDGHGGPAGLSVHRLAADIPGGHFEASGALGTDGTLANGRFDLVSPDAAGLPATWRQPVRLWQGPFHVALTGAGPPKAIDAQLRADLGDLRGEAEGQVDIPARHMTATVTLRHPGAPRLLDAFGLQGAEAWLGFGSLAVSAHLEAWPGRIQAQDFSVSAASLQLGGRFAADMSGAVPDVEGQINAATLVLPAGWSPPYTQPLPWPLMRRLNARIGLNATEVLTGLSPFAKDVTTGISIQDGELLVPEFTAVMAGGQISGQLAIDSQVAPPVVSINGQGIRMAVPTESGPILAPGAGSLDWSLTATSQGYSVAALQANASGWVEAAAHGIGLQGFDLAKASALLVSHSATLRAPLQAALASGATGPMDGPVITAISNGHMTIEGARLSGAAGTVDVAGDLDMTQSTLDLTLRLAPMLPVPPAIDLRLTGPLLQPARTWNLKPALAWAGSVHRSGTPQKLPSRRRDNRR